MTRVRAGSEKRTAALLRGVEGVTQVKEGTAATAGYVAVQGERGAAQKALVRRVVGVMGVVGEVLELPEAFEREVVQEASGRLFNAGDGVRIRRGPFEGVFGRVEEQKSDGRVSVLAGLLGRDTLVEVPEEDLEAL